MDGTITLSKGKTFYTSPKGKTCECSIDEDGTINLSMYPIGWKFTRDQEGCSRVREERAQKLQSTRERLLKKLQSKNIK